MQKHPTTCSVSPEPAKTTYMRVPILFLFLGRLVLKGQRLCAGGFSVSMSSFFFLPRKMCPPPVYKLTCCPHWGTFYANDLYHFSCKFQFVKHWKLACPTIIVNSLNPSKCNIQSSQQFIPRLSKECFTNSHKLNLVW